jgi:hypothetical protein
MNLGTSRLTVAIRPKAGAGAHEIIALQRPFASCGKLSAEVYGAPSVCKERTNGFRYTGPCQDILVF